MPAKPPPDLNYLRTIILAAIDHEAERWSKEVPELSDMDVQHYRLRKKVIEQYYESGDLKKLQLTFKRITQLPRLMGDLSFGIYIKEKTGLTIDLFEGLQERVDKIIANGTISNKKEAEDIGIITSIRRQTAFDLEEYDRFRDLKMEYHNRTAKEKIPLHILHHANVRSVIYSPDKQRKIVIYESELPDGVLITDVWVHSEGSGSSILTAKGINLDVKIYWKNATTIIVERKKGSIDMVKKREEVTNPDGTTKIIYRVSWAERKKGSTDIIKERKEVAGEDGAIKIIYRLT